MLTGDAPTLPSIVCASQSSQADRQKSKLRFRTLELALSEVRSPGEFGAKLLPQPRILTSLSRPSLPQGLCTCHSLCPECPPLGFLPDLPSHCLWEVELRPFPDHTLPHTTFPPANSEFPLSFCRSSVLVGRLCLLLTSGAALFSAVSLDLRTCQVLSQCSLNE